MNIFKTTYKSCILLLSVLGAGLSACSDEKFEAPKSGWMEVDMENSIAIPLNIDMGVDDGSTRGEGDKYDYSKEDHRIDITTEGESYAILFDDKNKFLYLKPFSTNSLLGNGSYNSAGISEFTIPLIIYIPKEDKDKVAKILVVLNGGRIYSRILEKFNIDPATGAPKLNTDGTQISPTPVEVKDFLNFEWESTSNNDVIGTNDKGYFTMTNSTYYDEEGELQNVVSLDKGKFVDPKIMFMNPTQAAATVYVERMQAKFEAPDLGNQVIGSDRVFRPSQNALSMIIYDWDEENKMVSEQKNWRVHLLGWTINGRETSSYLFKHITDKNGNKYNFTDFSNWNDPGMKRSNWSVDPHYFTSDKNNDDETFVFYPWQYRIAIDHDDQISLVKEMEGDEVKSLNTTTLRYFNFNEVKAGDWNDALTISENTFDPESYPSNTKEVYDGRAQLLCGPHLLVAAEVFVEADDALDSDYLGQFTKVEHLYSDRLRRFYLNEVAWFKMFIHDFNYALETQEHMEFHFYNWNKIDDDTQPETHYSVYPTGSCRLIYDPSANGDDIETTDPRYPYINKELTPKLLDELIDKGIITSISLNTYIKDGDGRVIPWIDGLVIRNKGNKEERLPVYPTSWTEEEREKNDPLTWTDDMRKSLIFDWFGPIDHYANGYMYYAGAITHHKESTNSLPYFGAVRNHIYKFKVNSINSLGTPVDNPSQPIIPLSYNYDGMISVYIDILDWHSMDSEFNFN